MTRTQFGDKYVPACDWGSHARGSLGERPEALFHLARRPTLLLGGLCLCPRQVPRPNVRERGGSELSGDISVAMRVTPRVKMAFTQIQCGLILRLLPDSTILRPFRTWMFSARSGGILVEFILHMDSALQRRQRFPWDGLCRA